MDSDPEDLPSDDEDDDKESQQKRTAALLAEKTVCELAGKMVLAIVGGVLDSEGKKKGQLKERLLRNKAKLGPNFKEVVADLEAPKQKRKPAPKKAAAKKKQQPKREELEELIGD